MSLNPYINKKVLILTVDGRTLVGTLLSTDQLTNLALLNTVERIIRTPDDPEPSSQIEHGLYLIRGDNVVVCGEVDEGIDNDIDWTKCVWLASYEDGVLRPWTNPARATPGVRSLLWKTTAMGGVIEIELKGQC